jgi:hypothetical protein
LAVTFYDGIEIFPDGASGWGIGQTYTQPDGTYFTFSCAYDTSGNLFFDSDTHTSSFQLTELLVGSRSFVTIALSRGFDIAGGLFWDGKYLAVADVRRHGRRHQKLLPTIVYRFAIQGDYGTEVSATKLRKGDGGRFWIQGPVLLSGAGDSVGFWRYPRGGQPRKVLQIPDGFSGLAVSPGT